MKKRVLNILLVCWMMVSIMPAAVMAAPSDPAVIEVGTVDAEVGDTVKVPVRITTNPGIMGLDLTVSFDEEALTLTAIDSKEVCSGGTSNHNVSIKKAMWSITGKDVTTTGVMFEMTFTVEGSTSEPVTVSGELTDSTFAFLTNVTFKPGAVNVPADATSHSVAVNSGANGTARVDKTSAQAGETVRVTATPNQGYEVDKITYTPAGGTAADITAAKSFTMPDADVTVNVTFKKIPAAEETQQDLSFAEDNVVKTYGDAAFTNAAVNHSAGGGRITYESSNTGVATVDNSGAVTIVGAGTANITATAAAIPGTYLETEASYQLTVNKASAQNLTRELTIRYNNTNNVTCDLKDILSGILDYKMGEASDPAGILAGSEIQSGILSVRLKSGLDQGAVNRTAAIPVTITSANYEDSAVVVTVRVTDQLLPTVSAEDITTVYTGSSVPDSRIRGTASCNGQTVPGTWSFKAGQSLANVRDSGAKTVVFTPNDSETYSRGETEIRVTITKATPSGRPSYTKINQAGMTLADAKLNTGSITPVGTIAWNSADSTVVSANTSYGWTFTPNDTDNYNTLTGSLQPYTVHTTTGGGSSSDDEPSYRVVVPVRVIGGTVKASPTSAGERQRVTLTVTPGYGYELAELTATDSKGAKITLTDKGNGQYTFTMPKDKVSVNAQFRLKAVIPVDPAAPIQTVVVNPTNDKLDVNGTAQSPAAYKINDYNYFKLRDIAALLNGTEKQFSVGYDSLTGAVTLTSGQPYTVTSADLAGVPDSAQQADVSTNVIYINGVQTQLTVYQINGYNYFKLRDLASALNFSVGWTAERGMFLETNKPYSE